jgi:hypothetical protein
MSVFDRNEAYIERARRMHGARGEFICDDVGHFARHALGPADIAVAIGILHHLDDNLASGMLLVDTVFPEPKDVFQRGHVPFPHSICIIAAARKPT